MLSKKNIKLSHLQEWTQIFMLAIEVSAVFMIVRREKDKENISCRYSKDCRRG